LFIVALDRRSRALACAGFIVKYDDNATGCGFKSRKGGIERCPDGGLVIDILIATYAWFTYNEDKGPSRYKPPLPRRLPKLKPCKDGLF
jgi:hypothetical protein